ncbi:hypothetical protein A3218_02665 [Pseudomonas chlororaphis]|nr:hypothetical protein A3218_02665 [Pseudomonas chlororaphis]
MSKSSQAVPRCTSCARSLPRWRSKVTGQTFGTATTGPAINLLRIGENLSAAWQRLAGTYVENLSWLDCAERYDRAHTFFYMDPPYWQTAGYGFDFPFEEYERMADFYLKILLNLINKSKIFNFYSVLNTVRSPISELIKY